MQRSFDDLPSVIRKLIFGYVWPELTISKVRAIYEERDVNSRVFDLHLFGYANEMRRIGRYFNGERNFLIGVSPKLMDIFSRFGIRTQDEFRDYYIRKEGVQTIVLWGLLNDSERTAFLDFIEPFLNGTGDFSLVAGWN
jgi:hypothetical protein